MGFDLQHKLQRFSVDGLLMQERQLLLGIGGTRADADVADQAVAQVHTGVDLLFVHLPDVDLCGHAASWMSAAYLGKVAKADEAIGRIMNALPEDTTLIVTADHGGHASSHGTTDRLDMTIPWIIAGPRIHPGYAITAPVSILDTTATAAFILGLTLPTDITGKAGMEAFARWALAGSRTREERSPFASLRPRARGGTIAWALWILRRCGGGGPGSVLVKGTTTQATHAGCGDPTMGLHRGSTP